jgi:fermentation-respiration switch protein FrsA (DUF1100 family)
MLSVGVALLIVYAAACALLYLLQDRFLYLPTPDISRPGAQSLRFERGDATLKVWALHPQQQAALIYFGGNAEDVGANLPDFDTAFPDRAVYLANYRGYGGSTGQPSERALIADAEAIFDWVAARHSRVALIGRSLGSGVATAVAASRPVERVVLVTPYDSIANVAADHFPAFPVRWLLRDRYDSLRWIGKVRAPVLTVVAERDEVIGRARSEALIGAMPAAIRHIRLIEGANHNDVSAFPAYLQSLRDFLAGGARSAGS